MIQRNRKEMTQRNRKGMIEKKRMGMIQRKRAGALTQTIWSVIRRIRDLCGKTLTGRPFLFSLESPPKLTG
jgi:hypothetical protein